MDDGGDAGEVEGGGVFGGRTGEDLSGVVFNVDDVGCGTIVRDEDELLLNLSGRTYSEYLYEGNVMKAAKENVRRILGRGRWSFRGQRGNCCR